MRIAEAYIGEYASGKSEVALNRALSLLEQGHAQVTLVDFDLVEPFYTLRPLKKELEEKGLAVLAWETRETIGLGEAGTLLRADMRWALRRPGDVIFDVGYGIAGARKIALIEGAEKQGELKIYVVVNVSRPMTSRKEEIVEYVRSLGRVDGLINNSHLGDDTDIETIQYGAIIVNEAALELGMRVEWTAAEEKFAALLGSKDTAGNPVRYIRRFMNRSFW